MGASVREGQGKSGRSRVDVRATRTWRVGLLPMALEDPRTLENAKNRYRIPSPNTHPSGTQGDKKATV